MDRRDLREQNRVSWNAVIGAHDSHRGDLSRFFMRVVVHFSRRSVTYSVNSKEHPSSTSSATRGATR